MTNTNDIRIGGRALGKSQPNRKTQSTDDRITITITLTKRQWIKLIGSLIINKQFETASELGMQIKEYVKDE